MQRRTAPRTLPLVILSLWRDKSCRRSWSSGAWPPYPNNGPTEVKRNLRETPVFIGTPPEVFSLVRIATTPWRNRREKTLGSGRQRAICQFSPRAVHGLPIGINTVQGRLSGWKEKVSGTRCLTTQWWPISPVGVSGFDPGRYEGQVRRKFE